MRIRRGTIGLSLLAFQIGAIGSARFVPQRYRTKSVAVFSNPSSGWRCLKWLDPDGLQDWRTWSEGEEAESRVELQKSTDLAVADGPRVYKESRPVAVSSCIARSSG
jgi:hypothetical protein